MQWRRLCTRAAEIEAAIERHTRISRDHLTPELRLRLLTAECPLYWCAGTEAPEHLAEPFWSIYWPGGQAVARYLLDEGARLFRGAGAPSRGLRVLDLGAGCGAAAIAAKIRGAADVLANDIDEVACVAARKNAQLNGVEIRTSSDNLLDPGKTERIREEHFDLVLVGDLLYDEETADRLESWLETQMKAPGSCEVLLGDPGRHGLTEPLRQKLERLRTYRLPDSVRRENHGYVEAAVYRFLPQSKRRVGTLDFFSY